MEQRQSRQTECVIPANVGSGERMIVRVPVADTVMAFTYFYIEDGTGHGFLIDPGAQADALLRIIVEKNWVIESILLTHGHFDHFGAADAIRNALGIPIYASEHAKRYLEDPQMNLSAVMGRLPFVLHEVLPVKDGDILCLKDNPDFSLKVIAVPGHTEDSLMFYTEKHHAAFVGDTIFKGSPGTSEYPGGNQTALRKSIIEKILALSGDTVLLSGHTDETTVSIEKHGGM